MSDEKKLPTAEKIKATEQAAHEKRNKPTIIVPNSPLNATKHNAEFLGTAIDSLIGQVPYQGVEPGKVDYLAIVGALSTVLYNTLLKIPKEHRTAMVDTCLKTIGKTRDMDDAIRVKSPFGRRGPGVQ